MMLTIVKAPPWRGPRPEPKSVEFELSIILVAEIVILVTIFTNTAALFGTQSHNV
jgi:hypothetical protein